MRVGVGNEPLIYLGSLILVLRPDRNEDIQVTK